LIAISSATNAICGGPSIEENLRYLSALYAVPKGMAQKRIAGLLEMFGVKEKANRLFNTLSTGTAKKVMICAALLHNPKVLLLDEVTAGLDPQTAIALRDFTRSLRDQSVTVIWTTHYMDEPEKLCDRVGVMVEGKLVRIGTPSELKRSVNELSILEIEAPGLSLEQVDKIRTLCASAAISYADPTLQITTGGKGSPVEEIAKTLLATGAKIRAVNTKEPTLEDVFLSLTGDRGH
jgi:ABC-2 type transport system ATP-binding protein